MSSTPPAISTLGALRASGYTPRSIHKELRANLIDALQKGAPFLRASSAMTKRSSPRCSAPSSPDTA